MRTRSLPLCSATPWLPTAAFLSWRSYPCLPLRPQQRRHVAMRDVWSSLLRRAGRWLLNSLRTLHQASPNRLTFWSPLPVVMPMPWTSLSSAPLDDSVPSGPHFHRIHNAKAARYGVPAGNTPPWHHPHPDHILHHVPMPPFPCGPLAASRHLGCGWAARPSPWPCLGVLPRLPHSGI